MRRISINKKIIIAITMILAIVAGSYALETAIKEQGTNSAALIKVTNNSKTAAYISDEVLKKLMEQELKDETISKGPTLLTALNAAGVNKFKEIEVKGKGSNNLAILNENNIDKNVILYLIGNGRVNLCNKEGTHLLVKEVNEINVKN